MSGYTQKQAERLKHKIDLDMAVIEDRAGMMSRRISDHSLMRSIDTRLEELREVASELKSTVDRRTRKA